MTTLPPQRELEGLIKKWENRWRLRRVLLYLPRVLMGGIAVGIVVMLLGLFTNFIAANTLPTLAIASVIGATVTGISMLGLFGRQGLQAAREFDQLFGMQERISTALELITGHIETLPEIADRQIADAYEIARDVDVRKHLKFKVRWAEWLGACVMIAALIVLLLLASLRGTSNTLSAAQQNAISSAAEEVRDITEDIATDSTLTDGEREALLESLEVSLDDLQLPDNSTEQAFASMSELENDLRDQAGALREDLAERDQALQDVLDAFEDALQNEGSQSSSAGGEGQSAEQMLQQMQSTLEAIDQLSESQRQALAQQFQNAAQAARENLPDASESLQEAAEALENADPQTQEALQEAFNELNEALTSQEQRQSAMERLDEAAQRAQEAARDIAESESQAGQQGDETTQSSTENDAQQQEQSAEQANQQQQDSSSSENFQMPVEPPQDADQAAQQPQNSGQSVQSQQGQQSQNEGDQSARQQEGEGQPQNQGRPVESQDGQPAQSANSGTSGAGDSEGQAQEARSTNNQPPNTDNNPDGGGVTQYAPIFAPRDFNAQASSDVVLEADAGDQPVQEGDLSENPDGEALVPYNQVFSAYADEANRALESDYVPLGLRDVVRDYFTSLEPQNNAGTDD